eukprot:5267357-Pleurochrysis_carterae.AAC.2
MNKERESIGVLQYKSQRIHMCIVSSFIEIARLGSPTRRRDRQRQAAHRRDDGRKAAQEARDGAGSGGGRAGGGARVWDGHAANEAVVPAAHWARDHQRPCPLCHHAPGALEGGGGFHNGRRSRQAERGRAKSLAQIK